MLHSCVTMRTASSCLRQPVWLSCRLTHQQVALKLISSRDLNPSKAKVALDAVIVQLQLHHPHIVKLLGVSLDDRLPGPTRLALHLEYCSGGDLIDIIQKQVLHQEHSFCLMIDSTAV